MNTQLISVARGFAMYKHKDQKDDNGKPYFDHLHQVAQIVSQVTKDEKIIAAAYLHDTLEDTDTTYTDLLNNFGQEIADLVNEVTHEGKKDEYGYYFPRLHTREAILIKFADRLSNLSRMDAWSEERKKHYLKRSQFWKIEKSL